MQTFPQVLFKLFTFLVLSAFFGLKISFYLQNNK